MSEMDRIIVDRYPLPKQPVGQISPSNPRATITYIYTNEPTIELVELLDDVTRKVQTLPANLTAELKPSLFRMPLGWAHRCYSVKRLSAAADMLPGATSLGSNGPALLDDEPAQPISRTARRTQINSAHTLDVAQSGSCLYLFNVLVALEWEPNAADLRQLMWAFRRASDFLYDVTDGYMAFGQVIFGDQSMLACADIQILASNRLLPRSWVGGMHDSKKYMPIRVGRGLWHDRNHTTIPWDEPEAYRTLIHEWGHFALHLRDAYLTQHGLVPARTTKMPTLPPQLLRRAPEGQTPLYTVAIPTIGLISESIMANLEGTSELAHHVAEEQGNREANEWEVIRKTGYYPHLPIRSEALDGPGRLPLPLPLFGRQSTQLATHRPIHFPTQNQDPRLFSQLPSQLEHCWLYVLSGITNEQHDPIRLIAQGTLDSRSTHTPFPLLGAQPDDTLLLIAETRSRASATTSDDIPTVLRSTITADGTFTEWLPATPPSWPVIDVLPEPVSKDQKDDQIARLRIRVTSAGALPNQISIFPLGHEQSDNVFSLGAPTHSGWLSPPQAIKTLDGHVFMRWDDQMLVVPFSQGGGPSFHSPAPTNPITAGSSDGAAALFFYDPQRVGKDVFEDDTMTDYSNIKVITTLAHGIPGSLPPGAYAHSHTYSMTSNAALPVELQPTLVLYYDPLTDDEALDGDLLLCRLQDGVWHPLPSYLPPGYPFIATPLASGEQTQPGGSLVASDAEQRVEYYKVCWLPRDQQETP